MSEHEPKPDAAQVAMELAEIIANGAEPSSSVVSNALVDAASDITALQEENRKQTFRADSNHRIMLNHAEASSAKSVEIQNLKAYIDKMTAEVQDAIGRERKRAEVAEKRALDNEARANAAEQRLKEAVKVLEPFASVIEDYDPWKEGDDTQGTLVIGSVTDYRLTLGHLRAARAFIKEAGE